MPERKHIFITGATGFLGSHLACEFMLRGHHIIALARSSKTTSAHDRIVETLLEVAPDAESFRSLLGNVRVIDGDISQEGLGIPANIRNEIAGNIDEVWHVAASLSFTQEDRDEIFRMNVGGTRNVLEFVKTIPSRRLHHVSTAYVAGNRTSVATEDQINIGQSFKNAYEESKCSAELLVQEDHQRDAIRASIFRPSIVIGDSKTGRVTHFHGVYAFLRGLWAARKRLSRRLPEGASVHLPLRVLGAPDGTLNFVPIDYVVDGMLAIAAQAGSLGNTYHLTNPEATPNRIWLHEMCSMLGVEGIQFVGQESFQSEPMNRLEATFQKQMAFYYMYLQGEPRFDCSHTLASLNGSGIECPKVNLDFMHKMTNWYLHYLNSEEG